MSDFGLLVSRYSSSLPTLTDGQYSTLQVDSSGRLLVTADISVIIDALGLNGAADSSNVIIVGTENGTGTGIKHAVKVESDGRIIVSDGGGSLTVDANNLDVRDLTHVSDSVKIGDGIDFLAIAADGSIAVTDNGASLTVDAVDLDIRNLLFATDKVDTSGSVVALDAGTLAALENITVSATNLDVRDLTHVSDSVKIGDGTDFLAVNTNGSINVVSTFSFDGAEEYAVTDNQVAAGDGTVVITATATPWVDAITAISVGVGQSLHIYGLDFSCDANAQMRLITQEGLDIKVLKVALNSSAVPTVGMFWGDAARIEVPGSATLQVKLQIKKRAAAGGDAIGSASLHARKVV